MIDWGPFILTAQLALVTTFILFVIAIPIAYWLSKTKSIFKPVLEAIVSLPLILPPTVLGFYVLIALNPNNGLGVWLSEWFGIELLFSFPGLVVGSVIYSLPFMINPIHSGLTNVSPSLQEASYILGKSKTTTLFKVLLPTIKPALWTGIVLTFAHTVGEFGVVLMIGGNIPDQTRVVSIAIYEEVEAMNYATAHLYSFVLLVLSFSMLLIVYSLNGTYLKRFWK